MGYMGENLGERPDGYMEGNLGYMEDGRKLVEGTLAEPVYITDNINVLFSEVINPDTVTNVGDGSGSFELYNNTTPGWVSGSIATSDNLTFPFDPTSDLTADDNYTIFLTADIKGAATGLSYSEQDFTFTAVALPFEDYTTYIEVDAGAHLTVASTKITVLDLPRNIDAYVYKDFGVNHFSEDLIHHFEISHTADDDFGIYYPWMLANSVDNGFGIEVTSSGDYLGLYWFDDVLNSTISIRESVGGVVNSSSTITVATGVNYYCEIERDETVGINGTAYLRIYTDAARTILQGSVSLALSAKIDYRYLYGSNSYNSSNVNEFSGYVQNLSIIS